MATEISEAIKQLKRAIEKTQTLSAKCDDCSTVLVIRNRKKSHFAVLLHADGWAVQGEYLECPACAKKGGA